MNKYSEWKNTLNIYLKNIIYYESVKKLHKLHMLTAVLMSLCLGLEVWLEIDSLFKLWTIVGVLIFSIVYTSILMYRMSSKTYRTLSKLCWELELQSTGYIYKHRKDIQDILLDLYTE